MFFCFFFLRPSVHNCWIARFNWAPLGDGRIATVRISRGRVSWLGHLRVTEKNSQLLDRAFLNLLICLEFLSLLRCLMMFIFYHLWLVFSNFLSSFLVNTCSHVSVHFVKLDILLVIGRIQLWKFRNLPSVCYLIS